jgi:hypothetical protein
MLTWLVRLLYFDFFVRHTKKVYNLHNQYKVFQHFNKNYELTIKLYR